MLRIRNWEKFQHYKTGRGAPPWIKLYRELLDDKEWFDLDPVAAKFLISCLLLAAEYSGALPDSETLAFRFRVSIKEVTKNLSLCKHWIIDDASNVLAEQYQVATPETETDKEIEKKRATRIPQDIILTDEWRAEAQKIKPEWKNGTIDRVFDGFKDYWLAVAGARGLKNDWFATWRNWCRNERTVNLPQVDPAQPRRPSL